MAWLFLLLFFLVITIQDLLVEGGTGTAAGSTTANTS